MTTALHHKNISLQTLYENTDDTIKGFEATYLLMPYEPEMNITFYGRLTTSNPLNSDYASSIQYDKLTGKLVSAEDVREASALHVTIDSFRKLHFGHFAGLTSKILWCILGLSPVFLAATGGYLYWYRRRKHNKRAKEIVKQTPILDI